MYVCMYCYTRVSLIMYLERLLIEIFSCRTELLFAPQYLNSTLCDNYQNRDQMSLIISTTHGVVLFMCVLCVCTVYVQCTVNVQYSADSNTIPSRLD